MHRFIFYAIVLISFASLAQPKLRKFSAIINHPAINVFAPYISADNRSLVYLSDNATDNALTLFYTKKVDAVNWKEPTRIPKRTINGRLTLLRGFALNANGKELYITSLQEGGLGGFDIHRSTLKESAWSTPINVGKPINSSKQEGAPSISLDGTALYFMRCQRMTQEVASGCALFVSKKNRMGKWEDPTALPTYINTGNSQVPRILADGETLLFSSDRLPHNKGKMDLYLTRFDGHQWSEPIPLDFANTDKDDQYVSASAFGRYLLKDQPGQRKNEIVELLFPPQVKPKACMRVDGQITGISNPSSSYINVFDRQKNTQIYSGRPDEGGAFTFYLKEGGDYDFAVEPAREDYTFYSKVYDLTKNNIAISSRLTVKIEPVSAGTELNLEGITFEPHTATMTSASTQALRRLTRIIKASPNYTFMIEVTFDGYQSDSIPSHPDLTEQVVDTLHFAVMKQVPDTLGAIVATVPDKADSTVTLEPYDSARVQKSDTSRFISMIVDSVVVKTTYHNNRTALQAQAITDYFIQKGIPANRLTQSCTTNDRATIAGRAGKTSIKVSVVK